MSNVDQIMEEEARLLKLAHEHQKTVEDIQTILASHAGRRFVKYLFKHLGVAVIPPQGLTGELLADQLGVLRAAQTVFKITAQADALAAGQILAELEKERYEELLAETRTENGRQ